MNKLPNSETPAPKTKIEYKNGISIELFPHCVGAFSFYTRKCIDVVGLLDEDFHNALEHVEHTFKIAKKNMHPPFWWFADIANSNNYLSDIPWSPQTSTISSKPNHMDFFKKGLEIFQQKHKENLLSIPAQPLDSVKQSLKNIFKNK